MPVSQEPISCRGDARARARPARPWHSQGTPEPCPSTSVAETTSPLPSRPMTATTPMRRCRATPHGCWPSCFPSEDVCQRSQEAIAAEGFSRDGFLRCCGAWSRPGSCRGTGCAAVPTPTGCTCRRCGHEAPPPREGLRPRPRRAAGPQRQGPHRRPTPRLGAPATASRASTRAR